jgi:hypothetical protein
MPIRFPTEAANDPGPKKGPAEDLPDVGADGTPRGRADGTPGRQSRTGADSRTDESRPGKDINQPGFVRDRDRDR